MLPPRTNGVIVWIIDRFQLLNHVNFMKKSVQFQCRYWFEVVRIYFFNMAHCKIDYLWRFHCLGNFVIWDKFLIFHGDYQSYFLTKLLIVSQFIKKNFFKAPFIVKVKDLANLCCPIIFRKKFLSLVQIDYV